MKMLQVFLIYLLSTLQVRCDVSDITNHGPKNSNSWSNYDNQVSPLKSWTPVTTPSPVTTAPLNNYISYGTPVQPTRPPYDHHQSITATAAPITTTTSYYFPESAKFESWEKLPESWQQQSDSLPQQPVSWQEQPTSSSQQPNYVPQHHGFWSQQIGSAIREPKMHEPIWQYPKLFSPNAATDLSSLNLTPMTQVKFFNQYGSENKDKKSSSVVPPVMPEPLRVMMPPPFSQGSTSACLTQSMGSQYKPQVNNRLPYLPQESQNSYYHWMITNNNDDSIPRSNNGGNKGWNLGAGANHGWNLPISGGNYGWNIPVIGNNGWNSPSFGGEKGWDSSYGGNNAWDSVFGRNNIWISPSSGSNNDWDLQSFGGNNEWNSPSSESNHEWKLPSLSSNSEWDSSSSKDIKGWNSPTLSTSGGLNIWKTSLGSAISGIPSTNGNTDVSYWSSRKRK